MPSLEAVSDLTIYLVLAEDGKIQSVEEYPLNDIDAALAVLKVHLEKGAGHGSMVVVGDVEPLAVKAARQSISAPNG